MICSLFTLEELSWIFTIAVPFVLLLWFFYSQNEKSSKAYYSEIVGLYGGFTEATYKRKDGRIVYSGIIMNIKYVYSNGFFMGDFDYAERRDDEENPVKDSINVFYGRVNHRIHFKWNFHPLKPNKNRIYHGKMYIVDRLDVPLKINSIEAYQKFEFKIKHYREMGALEFTFVKKLRKDASFTYPSSFVLYKKTGIGFDPYKNIKDVVFKNRGRVDKQD